MYKCVVYEFLICSLKALKVVFDCSVIPVTASSVNSLFSQTPELLQGLNGIWCCVGLPILLIFTNHYGAVVSSLRA